MTVDLFRQFSKPLERFDIIETEMLRTTLSPTSCEYHGRISKEYAKILESKTCSLRKRIPLHATNKVGGFGGEDNEHSIQLRATVAETQVDVEVQTDQLVDQDMATLNGNCYQKSTAVELLELFTTLSRSQKFDKALLVLEELVKAGREDVLSQIMHKDFIRRANIISSLKFAQLMPKSFLDCRTFNMIGRRCVQDQDLDHMLQTIDIMKAKGFALDIQIYTNLISVHGVCGNVQEAFQVYGDLKAAGITPDCVAVGAVAKACATKLKQRKEGERRQDLVLLERAVNLLQDLNDHDIQPDIILWNILVSCAGRTGQLHRAFNLLRQMKEKNCSPDSYTYCSLIDACSKSNNRVLAMNVYRLGIQEAKELNTPFFTAALEACMCGEDAVDMNKALEIYQEAEQTGVKLDTHFFTTLMRVAGQAGVANLSLSIDENMRKQGNIQCTNSCSAMISASIASGDLKLADKIYHTMAKNGLYPSLHQFTNLMQAYIQHHRFGDMVAIFEDMISIKLELDDIVLVTLLGACLKAKLEDLGFTVFTLLRAQGIVMSEPVCHAVLNLCLSKLQKFRCGIKSHSEHLPVQNAEGIALLRALCKDKQELPQVQEASPSIWMDRAISIYKTVFPDDDHSPRPTLLILNKLFTCLRLPSGSSNTPVNGNHSPRVQDPLNSYPSAHQFRSLGEDFSRSSLESSSYKMHQDNAAWNAEPCFDRRIIQFVKEAMKLDLLPPVSMESPSEIDLRNLYPAVAEGYVFTILETVKYRFQEKSYLQYRITFRVVPFDPVKALLPSSIRKENQPRRRHEKAKYGERTSLGVIAILRRLKLWHSTLPSEGVIQICPRDMANWIRSGLSDASQKSVVEEQQGTGLMMNISAQQREIRLMNVPSNSMDDDDVGSSF